MAQWHREQVIDSHISRGAFSVNSPRYVLVTVYFPSRRQHYTKKKENIVNCDERQEKHLFFHRAFRSIVGS